jgi:hypothetical protein
MFILFWLKLLPPIIVCKRSGLKFSIAVFFFTCALFKEYLKYIGFARSWLDSTRSVSPHSPPLRVWLDSTELTWTRLYSVGGYAHLAGSCWWWTAVVRDNSAGKYCSWESSLRVHLVSAISAHAPAVSYIPTSSNQGI